MAASGVILCLATARAEAPTAAAGTSIESCGPSVTTKGTSQQFLRSRSLMVVLLELQGQGETHFRPMYSTPISQCRLDEFDASAAHVAVAYAPWEKGPSTLHYSFRIAEAGGEREILVIYDGAAGFVYQDGFYFYVAETRAGVTSLYAMFKEQPSYAALKDLVVAILSGSAPPLAVVRWPPGEKEPVIDKFDAKRLK